MWLEAAASVLSWKFRTAFNILQLRSVVGVVPPSHQSRPCHRSAWVMEIIFLIGGAAPCSASATPPIFVSLSAVSKELLAQPQPTSAGLRGVAPSSSPSPSPRARKKYSVIGAFLLVGPLPPKPRPSRATLWVLLSPLNVRQSPSFFYFIGGSPRFAPPPRVGFSIFGFWRVPRLTVRCGCCAVLMASASFVRAFLYAAGFALAPSMLATLATKVKHVKYI